MKRYDFGNINEVHRVFFVERKKPYSELAEALRYGRSAILYGPPRIGKTAFVERFAGRFPGDLKQRKKADVRIVSVNFRSAQFSITKPQSLVEQFKKWVGATNGTRVKRKVIFMDELCRIINEDSIWSLGDLHDFINYLNDLMRAGWQLVLILQEPLFAFYRNNPKLWRLFPPMEAFSEIEITPFCHDEFLEYCGHSIAPIDDFKSELEERSGRRPGAINIMLWAANVLYRESGSNFSFESIVAKDQVRKQLSMLDWQRKEYDDMMREEPRTADERHLHEGQVQIKIDIKTGRATIGDDDVQFNAKELSILCMVAPGKSPPEISDQLLKLREWYEKHKHESRLCPTWIKKFDDRETRRKRFCNPSNPNEVMDDITDIVSGMRKKHQVLRELFPTTGNRIHTTVQGDRIILSNHAGVAEELREIFGLPPMTS